MSRNKLEFQIGAFLRIALVASTILIQLGVLAFITFYMRSHAVYLFILLEMVALVEVIFLVDNEVAGSYKLAWTIIILILPVFGWVLYLLWGKASSHSRKSQHVLRIDAKTRSYLDAAEGMVFDLDDSFLHRERFTRFLQSEGFPLYRRTSCRYLSQGEAFFTALIEDLKRAQRFIFLEFFIVADGQLWKEIYSILLQKAKAGVEVRFLLDDMGSMLRLPDELRAEGPDDTPLQVAAFNPMHQHVARFYLNYRNHRKSIIIDGDIGYIGGINLADEYANLVDRYGHWKDTGVRIEGAAVWSFTVAFLQMWSTEVKHSDLSGWDQYRPRSLPESQGYFQPFFDGPVNNPQNPAEDMYNQIINQAQRYVYISTPYLIIDDIMIGNLCTAAKSGVDVRIITPQNADRWFVHVVTRSNYKRLIQNGVKIYEYQPGFIHAKTILSDDEHAITGTINMDYRSFHLHFESGIWIGHAPVLKDIKADFLETFQVSQPIFDTNLPGGFFNRQPMQSLLRLFSPLM